jgi:hypothetical protein
MLEQEVGAAAFILFGTLLPGDDNLWDARPREEVNVGGKHDPATTQARRLVPRTVVAYQYRHVSVDL